MKDLIPIALYQQLLKKRAFVFKIAAPFLSISSEFYRGNKVFCPCCEGNFRSFLPFGANHRPNALCPGCLSLERHRLLWLYLKNKTNLFKENLVVLHVAPEYILQRKLISLPNLNYLTADIVPGEAMLQMDITNIQYHDNYFDVILCNHVLEHIPNDDRAMKELYRVLKPGGWAILQVPVDPKLAKTIEGSPTLTLKEREKLFGHHDHVRQYGLDYQLKLAQAGFIVKVDNYSQELGAEAIKNFGLTPDESIFLCLKPQSLD
ncbi:SAM-dependent methyltransferase [[Phormidium ambiguum] IAM M-71]|uniref:SAM-dependent methyltransferase n=1 Tax=[Phormidium ambiguum] IAM M-71 TaxID=454136 RepID=A0A1U7IRW8_9CYAN|nr:class I SAM-dependent methyltransferase [Phormidium ambiguum]OKH40204.1 SAM-dependent methyltransferase [Phormidium ambiguum IAM M-71]